MFTKRPDGSYQCDGLLTESIYQFHQSITISKEVREEVILQGTWRSGSFVFSDSFGPCMGVCAKLDNGEFAIYHAESPFSDAKGFSKFVAGIKGHVEDIFVFQKPNPPPNLLRAPLFALELQNALGIEEVKRIHISEGYTAIAAFSSKDIKAVVLCNIVNDLDEKQDLKEDKKPYIRIIDVKNSKYCFSIIDSAKEIIRQQSNGFFTAFDAKKNKVIAKIFSDLIENIKAQIRIMKNNRIFTKSDPALSACLEYIKKPDEVKLLIALEKNKEAIASNPDVKALVRRTLELTTIDIVRLDLTFEREETKDLPTKPTVPPVGRFGF